MRSLEYFYQIGPECNLFAGLVRHVSSDNPVHRTRLVSRSEYLYKFCHQQLAMHHHTSCIFSSHLVISPNSSTGHRLLSALHTHSSSQRIFTTADKYSTSLVGSAPYAVPSASVTRPAICHAPPDTCSAPPDSTGSSRYADSASSYCAYTYDLSSTRSTPRNATPSSRLASLSTPCTPRSPSTASP